MDQLPTALAPLTAYKQFVLWVTAERDGKLVKLPVNPHTGGVADAHDPTIWMDAQAVITAAALYGEKYGVGFVFTKDDPFYFLDIDKCLSVDRASWSDLALSLMNQLSGAAVEVSQSGRGLHIIGVAQTPEHACKNIPLGLELYTEGRFVALTGTNCVGSADFESTAALTHIIGQYFPPKVTFNDGSWTSTPSSDWIGPEDDETLIKKALATKSAGSVFGDRASFKSLWNNDIDVLAEAYPDQDPKRAYDYNCADAALAQHLSFWTGNNCDRIARLMWLSKLVRKKWERHDYIYRTITKAVSMQATVYKAKVVHLPVDAAAPLGNTQGPEVLSNYQYLAADQQLEHFKDCIYIQDMHKVFIPSGSLLKPDQFNATYGGYSFQMEAGGSSNTTKKAWEAFTVSQIIRYPKAESACFRPDLEPRQLVEDEGRLYVNTYIPLTIPLEEGDVSPFLLHLSKILPDDQDRAILLAYMAACVQHKGVKFQWAPLLQGAEGNGKTLLTRCVAHALGKRYTHMPPASEIGEKFNAWLFGKLFIGIEDVYVPEHKRELIEILKPMITNDFMACRAMNTDQFMANVCANFMLNSNYKDAIRKTINDRRFCVFYTAQQTARDVTNAGMGGLYFPRIYEWLRNGGYTRVAHYLNNYAIPDALNPATNCHRAPPTTSTAEAVTASLGGVEQEILEAIHEGRPGFRGGWISSMALERLLQGMRASRAIPQNKRRDMLIALQYDWHPALTEGRVNNVVIADGGKPRLFIKNDHAGLQLTSPAEIVKAYERAQLDTQSTTAEATQIFSN